MNKIMSIVFCLILSCAHADTYNDLKDAYN